MSTPATRETQQDILSLLTQAQSLIGDAAELACPVRGWSKEWHKLQKQYDAIKATWHAINNATLTQ
jgi:hypothetical protein